MQTLQVLVRNLAVILLMATFLEMLLPNRSMRGYIQLVMGLFVISAVLAPVTSFLKLPLTMEIPAWSTVPAQDLPVLAADHQGSKIGRDAVQEQFRQILIHQIQALTVGVSGVKDAEVEVHFEDNTGELTEEPRIADIKVKISSQSSAVKPIEPIHVDGTNPGYSEGKITTKAEEVQEKLSSIMGIPKEKITVTEN